MINLPVPYFCQRENKYIWYQKATDIIFDDDNPSIIKYNIGDSITETEKVMGPITCNITSLCMILNYFGITDDTPDDMMYKIFDSDEFANDSKFSVWRTTPAPNANDTPGPCALEDRANMKHIANVLYGLETENEVETFGSLKLERAKKFIDNGLPVWFSYGALTLGGGQSGHIAVLRGYNDDGFIVNDPYGNVADPDGFLRTPTSQSMYSYSYRNTYNNIDSGWGTGENSFIQKTDFVKTIINNVQFNQALVIKPKKIWFFPTISRGEIINLNQQEFYDKTIQEEVKIPLNSELNVLEAAYPICENGKWHTGIHVKGCKDKKIFPIGPGRLVAVRNTDELSVDKKDSKKGKKSNNFVLIRHNVPNKKEYFFSYYLHLDKINIQERLNKNFSFNILQSDSRDWLDQIMDHIMPKRILFFSKQTLYERNSSGDYIESSYVGDAKTIAFFYPFSDMDRNTIYSLTAGNMNNRLDLLNNIKTYKDPNSNYYRIMLKQLDNNQHSYKWKEVFVELVFESSGKYASSNVSFPQKRNEEEFSYFMNKLISLNNGETVILNEEDKYKPLDEISGLSLKSFHKVFYDLIYAKLQFTDLAYSETTECVNQVWVRIKNYYLENKTNLTIDSVWTQLYEIGKYLLNYTYTKISGAFEITDNFFTSMKNCFKDVYKEYTGSDNYEMQWESLKLEMRINYSTNTDFHIEMGNSIPLGTFGKVKDQYKIHFDIFSDKKFIEDNTAIKFDLTDYSVFYNKNESVKLLQKKLNISPVKRALNHKKLNELYFNVENLEKLRKSSLKINNDIIEYSDAELQKLTTKIRRAIGYNEQDDTYREKKDKIEPGLFLKREEITDKNLKASKLFYYYPPYAIWELNELRDPTNIFNMNSD